MCIKKAYLRHDYIETCEVQVTFSTKRDFIDLLRKWDQDKQVHNKGLGENLTID